MRWALIVAGAALAAWAQTAVEPAALGYLLNTETSEALTIVGAPGAARLERGPAALAVHPATGYIIAPGSEGSAPVLLAGVAAEPRTIEGLRADPSAIVFGDSGRTAAALFAEARAVQVIAGIPEAPRVVREVAVNGDAPLLDTAVSDSGETVAVRTESQVILAGADQVRVAGAAALSMRFIANSEDVLIAAADGVVISSATGEITPVARAADGIGEVTAARFIDGRKRLLVLGSGRAAVHDLESGGVAGIEIPGPLAGIEATAAAGWYRVSSAAGSPVWLVDTTAEQPARWFVPAVAKAEADQ